MTITEVMRNSFLVFAVLICTTVFSQNWEETFSGAIAQSKAQNKPLILVFSGSDWCAPCIKLDQKIWQSEEFVAYAKKNYILYRADFPRKKTNRLSAELQVQNEKLAEKYNPKGYFPLVIILDAKEEVLGKTGYANCTPKEYLSKLNEFIK